MLRRALLLSAGVATAAGCQSIRPGAEPVRLGVTDVINHVEREQQVDVEILAAGESVHETTVTLEAAEPNQPTGTVLEKQWPDEARAYTVRIHSALEADPVEVRLDEPRTDSCEPLSITLRESGVHVYRGTAGECYGDGEE